MYADIDEKINKKKEGVVLRYFHVHKSYFMQNTVPYISKSLKGTDILILIFSNLKYFKPKF